VNTSRDELEPTTSERSPRKATAKARENGLNKANEGAQMSKKGKGKEKEIEVERNEEDEKEQEAEGHGEGEEEEEVADKQGKGTKRKRSEEQDAEEEGSSGGGNSDTEEALRTKKGRGGPNGSKKPRQSNAGGKDKRPAKKKAKKTKKWDAERIEQEMAEWSKHIIELKDDEKLPDLPLITAEKQYEKALVDMDPAAFDEVVKRDINTFNMGAM